MFRSCLEHVIIIAILFLFFKQRIKEAEIEKIRLSTRPFPGPFGHFPGLPGANPFVGFNGNMLAAAAAMAGTPSGSKASLSPAGPSGSANLRGSPTAAATNGMFSQFPSSNGASSGSFGPSSLVTPPLSSTTNSMNGQTGSSNESTHNSSQSTSSSSSEPNS